jgi:hypothetical protein
MPGERDPSAGDAGRDADLDAAFAQIVAGWDDEPTDEIPRWPASEDTTDDPPPASSMEQIRYVRDHGLPTPAQDPADGDVTDLGVPTGPRDWELAEQPEEHFVPPDPPLVRGTDLVSTLSWAGLVLGPAFLLVAALFWRDVGRMWLACATAAFVGGFVSLVLRLPQSHDDDEDDGAVV